MKEVDCHGLVFVADFGDLGVGQLWVNLLRLSNGCQK